MPKSVQGERKEKEKRKRREREIEYVSNGLGDGEKYKLTSSCRHVLFLQIPVSSQKV
jgi:hypothetical protein